ncbi:LysR family transcriptional regulator [Bdellovibrio sp. SKB1291214]|uniref:LysR family transcriptional regulator n=1 Tax=Bdellovibrio sp. SKB1291214 TaxID=1732569 RepID=UPI000B517773|nr:LysR family transcriptional regulator [Bdellovibrio sp. SKB1291214]UYL09670.1 LysR family transcriptional regulator [Bdellovibrio sp. SKB1291214]
MDRIENMHIFMKVAELGSFTGASEHLSLPKATVSNAIQQLENNLGTRLFHRTTRKVQLTQDGMTFFERCRDLLSDVDEVENLFKKDASQVHGRIRIDMGAAMARNAVVPKLPQFLKMYPDVQIELSCSDRKVDLVREGFDCVIRVGNLADSGLIARPLGKFAIGNYASTEYLEKYGRPRKLEDLQNHYLVHYVQSWGGKPDGFEYFDGEKYRTLAMKSKITVNNVDSYTAACLAGLGIIQAPSVGKNDFLHKKKVEEILPKLRAEAMPVSIVYPHRRNVAKRVQVFMDWLESILKDYVE